MFRFAEEVAYDLIGLLVNPDVEPLHPMARNVALFALAALVAVGMAAIYVEDGVIAL